MTKQQEITCIVCPIGCKIIVQSDKTSANILTGHRCKEGIQYATTEALDPRRMLTSSILVHNGEWPLVSVKTSIPVPKKDIFRVLQEIRIISVDAPIKRGDILISNVANLNIDIIATKTIPKKKKD
jgi:CxxC motif-containing protein